MSKMTCMEAIFDVLTEPSPLVTNCDCFDDLVMACFALASGEGSEPDVPAWIAAHDKERSEVEIYVDICDFFAKYHGKVKPSAVLARAIAAGKAAL